MLITEPTLLLDKQICLRNIERMAAKAKKNRLIFRPHFKTHQSHEIGRWFRDAGVDRITVSSLKMAEYFAQDGWNDITVAFPINILEIDRINRLAASIQLHVLIESMDVAHFLADKLENEVQVFLKIDVGYHRTGIDSRDTETIEALMATFDQASKLNFKGFLAHAGHSYGARGVEEIGKIHEASLRQLQKLRSKYIPANSDLIISTGDTPTCSTMDRFEGVDEIRPGNFVFYDITQQHIGSCQYEDIAVALACPIVAKHAGRLELIVYGGGVHFSKDRLETNGKVTFGKPVKLLESGWQLTYDDSSYVSKLSQEHGTIQVTQEIFDAHHVGDLMGVLPVHSCMTADLMKEYYQPDGVRIVRI